MKGKLLHILGGGTNQIPLIKKAQSLGVKVLVTDMYPDPPAKSEADFFEQVNTRDIQSTLAVAKKYKIDAIMTDQTDVAVPTVAYIAQELNLVGIGYDVAQRFCDKAEMREALKEKFQSNMPDYHYFADTELAVKFLQKLISANDKSKFVIKPVNSQGSKAVFIVNLRETSIETLKAHVEDAIKESLDHGILIEEFIEGYEVAVESYVDDGEVYNLVLSQKEHFAGNNCLDSRVNFLAEIDADLESKIFDLNTQIIQELGLEFGITHAEYMIQDNTPYLIEVAARGAGSGVSGKIVPYLAEFDSNLALIKRVFKENNGITKSDYKNRFAILDFFKFKPGKVKEVQIDPKIYELSLDFNLNIREGDLIEQSRDSRSRPGYIIVCSDNKEKVLEKLELAKQSIKIIYD